LKLLLLRQGYNMHLEYRYLFSGSRSIPEFLIIYSQEYHSGEVMVRLSPVSNFGTWSEMTFKFWEYLKTEEANDLPPWFALTVYGSEEESFRKKDYLAAQLYALDTMTFFGHETDWPVESGCLVCGNGRVLKQTPMVDESTVVSWQAGFSDKGRFIIHITKYEEMLHLGMKGIKPKPVECRFPDCYVISLWCGNIEKNRMLLQEFPEDVPDGVLTEERGDRTTLIVPSDMLHSGELDDLGSYLADLDEKEELYYSLIPPGKEVSGIPACRWVELEITGTAGEELDVNEYHRRAICPNCGHGGFCTRGQLVLDLSKWDASDFCLTEVGRLCVSKRAYRLVTENWGLSGEPIKAELQPL
jgi:hypothetical protein